MNARTIHVHRNSQHVAAIPCDPDSIGWVIAADAEPFTLQPGDRLDLAVTYTPRWPASSEELA